MARGGRIGAGVRRLVAERTRGEGGRREDADARRRGREAGGRARLPVVPLRWQATLSVFGGVPCPLHACFVRLWSPLTTACSAQEAARARIRGGRSSSHGGFDQPPRTRTRTRTTTNARSWPTSFPAGAAQAPASFLVGATQAPTSFPVGAAQAPTSSPAGAAQAPTSFLVVAHVLSSRRCASPHVLSGRGPRPFQQAPRRPPHDE